MPIGDVSWVVASTEETGAPHVTARLLVNGVAVQAGGAINGQRTPPHTEDVAICGESSSRAHELMSDFKCC